MEATTLMDVPVVPLEGEGEEGVELHVEPLLEGDGQLTLGIGGHAPTTSTVRMAGGQIPFTGQMKKGDFTTLRVECRCSEIHVIDTVDVKTREIVKTNRKHVLRVEGVEIVSE